MAPERTSRSESRSSRPKGPERSGSLIDTVNGRVTRDALSSLAPVSDPAMKGEDLDWPKERQAYVTLFGGFLLMFNSWGIVNAYGTFSSYYLQRPLYGKDVLLLNLIGSTQCFIILGLSGVVGRLVDADYTTYLLWIGTAFVTAGQFALSACVGNGSQGDGSYGLIWLTQGLLTSLGMACFFVSSSQVVATWFKKKKGLAIGIVASGASISGLIYPVMLKQLTSTGALQFKDAVLCYAGLSTATCILAALIAKPNPAVTPRKPENWTFDVFFDRHAFNNKAFTFLCLAIATLFFGFYAIFFNLEEWAAVTGVGYKDGEQDLLTGTQRHSKSVRTFFLLATMNGASTIGRVTSAYYCDKLGALNVHTGVTFVASLLVLILWSLAKTVSSTWAFVICFGVFSGAVIGLPPASVAYILGNSEAGLAKLGQWTGMMYTCAAIPALTGPIIAGHLITTYDSFLTVQLWSGTCLLLSAFFMLTAVHFRLREHGLTIKTAFLMWLKTKPWKNGSKERGIELRKRANASQEGFSQATSIRGLEKGDDDDDKESDEVVAGAPDDRRQPMTASQPPMG